MIRTKTAIDPARIARVVQALRAGDYSACGADDWQHCDDLLCVIGLLENNVPGLGKALFEGMHREAAGHWLEEHAAQAADRDGFGDEWRAAIAAGRSPGRKDYRMHMSEVLKKAHGVNQQAACRMMAEQEGKAGDIGDRADNVRRVVINAKARSKGD